MQCEQAVPIVFKSCWIHWFFGCLPYIHKEFDNNITRQHSWYTPTGLCHHQFLLDWPWMLLWIKLISNQLDILFHVLAWVASQLSGNCDVTSNWLWHQRQNINRASEKQSRCVRIVVFIIYGFICHVRNKIMYVLPSRTVYMLTRGLFWCLF